MYVTARLAMFAALAASLATSAPAFANSTYGLTLRGEVPVICRAEIQSVAAGEAGETSATLSEFCNSAAGYKVYATVSDEDLRVSVDGLEIAPEADGRFLLASEARPNIASRDLIFAGASSGTISITVVAA